VGLTKMSFYNNKLLFRKKGLKEIQILNFSYLKGKNIDICFHPNTMCLS
jgi:hypothetical protein